MNFFNSKKIMILGAGEMQVPLIKEAIDLGCKVHAIDKNKEAPGFEYCANSYKISTNNKEEILQLALNLGIDGIITNSDYPVRTIAYVCNNLNLKGPSEDLAKLTTNKYLQRELFKKNNIPIPYFIKEKDHNKLKLLYSELSFPLIVKPVDSSGSRGVSLVRNIDEYKIGLDHALASSKSNDIIVEEFLIGREFSLEVLIQNRKINIISITEKKTVDTKGKSFVEERHIIPAKLNKNQIKLISDLTNDALNVLKANECAAHVEIILTKKGAYIIEIASRLGGDYITSDLVPLSSGVNMLENIIRLCLGSQIKVLKTKFEHSGIQFIYSDNYDLVNKHLDKIIDSNNLIRLVRGKNKSQKKIESSLDRIGYYICKAKNRKKLLKLLEYN